MQSQVTYEERFPLRKPESPDQIKINIFYLNHAENGDDESSIVKIWKPVKVLVRTINFC